MKKSTTILCLLFLFCGSLLCQSSEGKKIRSRHEYGLNISPLVFQLVPFRSNENRTGPYNFLYNYRRGNKGFSAGLGLRIHFDNNIDISHFNLRMGYRKYRVMTPHWEFYRGFDFILTAGSFNLPQDSDSDTFGVGFGFPLGIAYRINDYMSLSTEAFLFLGVLSDFGGDASPIQVVPPISIMFNVRL